MSSDNAVKITGLRIGRYNLFVDGDDEFTLKDDDGYDEWNLTRAELGDLAELINEAVDQL